MEQSEQTETIKEKMKIGFLDRLRLKGTLRNMRSGLMIIKGALLQYDSAKLESYDEFKKIRETCIESIDTMLQIYTIQNDKGEDINKEKLMDLSIEELANMMEMLVNEMENDFTK